MLPEQYIDMMIDSYVTIVYLSAVIVVGLHTTREKLDDNILLGLYRSSSV